MKIVIEIPKEMHKAFIQGSFGAKYNMYDLVGCVMNGTPLPKGHGDLIDRKVLLNNGYQMEPVEMWYGIKYAPTIIEADKESEDKE